MKKRMNLKEKIESDIYTGCRYGDGSTAISEKVVRSVKNYITTLIKEVKTVSVKYDELGSNFRQGQIDALMQVRDMLK